MKLIYKFQESIRTEKTIKILIGCFVFLYVFLIPTVGESETVFHYSIYIVMVLLAIIVGVYWILYGGPKISRSMLLVPAFALFAFIGTAMYSHEFKRWFSLILLSISFFVFLTAFSALKNKWLVIHIVSIALSCFSIVFIIYYRSQLINFSDFASGHFRLGDDFDNPNSVAVFETVCFSMSLYQILFYKKKRRFFHIIPLLLSIIVGVSTGSRSFILAVILFIVIYLFFVFKKHKWLYLFFIAVLFVCFIGFINLPFMSTIKDRFIIAFQTLLGIGVKVDTSTVTRAIWADYGFFLGLKNGIFGYGTDGFAIYSGVGTYSHNNYAEVICDFGFVGLAIFYLPLFILFIYSIKSNKASKSIIISFVVYFLVISLSSLLYYKKIYYMVLALLYYLLFYENNLEGEYKLCQIHKIVFTCDTMESGGAERVISILSNEMANRGYCITIIGVSNYQNSASFYNLDSKIKYLSISNKNRTKINPVFRVFKLRRLLLDLKPDAVISFLPHINIYTSLALMFTRITHITSERNNPYVDPKGKFKRFLKKLSFNIADGCVFQTEDAMNYYSPKVQKKSAVIYNPIENGLNNHNCLFDSKKTILAVGRLVEQKNYHCLLDAFKLFSETFYGDYQLRIYGDGPLKQELINYCKKISISNSVVFLGNDLSWREKERNSSMYVLSSNYEGFPNSLLEAMCIGIPSISTDCPSGGPRKLIENEKNGYLVPVGDAVALAEAMKKIIMNRNKFSMNCELLAKTYSSSKIVDEWINFIKVSRVC